MHFIAEILIIFFAVLNFLLTGIVWFRLRQPTSFALWALKVFTSALSPFLFLLGILLVLLGTLLNATSAIMLAGLSSLLYFIHIINTTRAPEASTGISSVFGVQWESKIPEGRRAQLLPNRYVFRLPKVSDPVFEQDIVFHTIPESGRQLLCDIWQPPENVESSGLAFIYLHGSAWTVLDKDYGTRTFFRHLANQGHLIMDVAYRLFPETDMMGMVHDANHAVAWLKANAVNYGVNPRRIVIGGGSAGGHIALLAAYTNGREQFLLEGLEPIDTSVKGVISLYGPTDLVAAYYHCGQHIVGQKEPKAKADEGMPQWLQRSMGKDFHRLGFDKTEEPGMLVPMLGGTPEEIPEVYARFSPITHVHEDCPATLLLQGEHDMITSAKATRQLYRRLQEAKVPTVMHIIPQTDHAFDLVMPKWSPSAQNGYYDVERFLGVMVE